VNWLKVAEKTLALPGGVVAYQEGGRRTGPECGESGDSAGDHCRSAKADWDLAREEVTANECLGTKAKVQEKINGFFGG